VGNSKQTAYGAFVERWKDCKRCLLCNTRQHVVLARGKIPCDVVLVGEGPGESEDSLALPFVGPAGKLLDEILSRAVPEGVKYSLTNLVCCIPRGDDGTKTAQPPDEAIKACSPRLQQFIALCKPKLIVTVGALARDYLEQGYKYSIKVDKSIAQVTITHPSAVLRSSVAMRGLAIQRCIVVISNAIDEYVTSKR
jgi:uracil-DNA glycosylase family 4